MRKFVLLSLTVFAAFTASAQDFSNKGKDFWVGYGYHTSMQPGNGNSQDMVLYFATDQVTNITVNIPGVAYTQTITTAAGYNVVTSATIPKNGVQDARLLNVDGISNKGIHITSDRPMVAYAHVYNGNCSGATILYPTNTLGKEYYSVNYKNWSNTAQPNCWFYVVATDTGTTTVEITPQADQAGVVTTGGWVAGTTYTVNLTQGQIYNVVGILTTGNNPFKGVDLTGSKVKSISNGTGCKKVAVFSGSGRISITCNATSSSSDNYMVQAMPKTAWGKKYLTTPALGIIDAGHPLGNAAFNFYRVCVSSPAAIVKINGAVTGLPLQNNFYYEIPQTNQPMLIEADSAIMVSQYFTSQGSCGNGNPGDPEVIYLSAVEQNISTVQWNATPNFAITAHYLNVVIPNGGTGVSSFTFDGFPYGGFIPHPQDPAYSYLRLAVGGGASHVIKSDSGFNAIAYGFGNAESYGYNAGTNIKDLYQQILVQTQYGIESSPSVCTDAPFRFKVSLPYCADSIRWDLSGLPGPPPAPPTIIYTTCTPGPGGPDSTTIVNGKTIYWYSLPNVYTFSTIGTFPVTITTYNSANPDGCGNAQDIDFELVVSAPPVADFSWLVGGCVAEPVKFTETTSQVPKTTYSFYWNFGDPGSGASNISNLRNPTHIFSAPGTYTVKYAAITTPGCLTDTATHTVTVVPVPTAAISGTTTVCINAPSPDITFTATDGTAPYTFSYHINAGPVQTIQTTGTNISVTLPAPTTVAGIFIYHLDSVKNTGSILCNQPQTGTATVTVLPDHTISLTSANAVQTVCINTPIAPIIYTLGGGATGATITGLPAGVTYAVAGTTLTISGSPTTTAGSPFNFSVTTTGNSCLTAAAAGTITVNPDHAISLTSGNAAQTVCINTLIAPITYLLSGGATGVTITGLPAGVTYAVAGTTLTISGAPTTTAGSPFSFSITTTGNSCITASASGTITVLPDHTISLTSANAVQTVCINTPIAPITYTLGGGATGATITGLPAGVTYAVAGTTLTISGTPTTTAGSPFNFSITTTGNSCLTAAAAGTITVNPDHAISLTSGNATQTVCINVPITPITYLLSGGATGVTITGLPAGVTYAVVGTTLTINGAPTTTAGSPFSYSIATTGNTCITASASGTITVLPNHTLTLTSPAATKNQTVCINTAIVPITFTLGGGATGALVTGLPAGVTYAVAGTTLTISGAPTTVVGSPFLFSITTTGNTCIVATDAGSIAVNPNHVVTLTSGSNIQAVCLNTPIAPITYTLSAGATGATVTGLPAGVTGTVAGNTVTIIGTPTTAVGSPFNYTVTTTGNTCVIASATGTITVHRLPTPNFNYTIPSCETRTINFTDASVANSGLLNGWSWNFGDPGSGPNNISSLQNPTHVFSAAGTYNVTLSVSTNLGCSNAAPIIISVTVNNRPQAGFMIPEVCINDVSAVFTDTSKIASGTITAWEWDFGDGSPRTFTQHGTHLYLATGVYQVMHIVTSALGCKDTLVQPITINGANPTANFTVGNPASLCANDSVAITNLSVVNFGNVTRLEIYWDNVNLPAVFDFDDFPTIGKIYKHLYPNFQAPLIKPFSIRMRAFSGTLCYNDYIVVINVNAAPKVQFNNMPDVCLLIPPFQITQASEVGGVPGNGIFSGPGVSPTGIFNPAVAGIGLHTIKYTFTSTAGGCVDTMSKTIRVLDTAHAKFTFVSPICQTVPGSFTDVSTAPATVLLSNTVWNFGDGSPIENHAPGSTFGHLFPGPGTYTVTMYNVSTYGCNSTVYSEVVTVSPDHTITLNSANNTQTICINKLIAPIVYTIGGGATNVTITGLPPGVGYTLVGNTVTISGTPTSTALSPYNYNILTTGNTCVVANATGKITVEPDHTLTVNAGSVTVQSVCINTAITPIIYTIGGGATDVTVTGLPPGVSYTVVGNTVTITGTPNTILGGPLFAYAVQTIGNSCIKANAAGSIRVNPYPVPNFAIDKPSYCIPNAIVGFINGSAMPDGSGMTYVWNFGDGPGTSTAVNPSHWYTSQGPFNVRLIVTSTTALTPSGVGCSHDTIIIVNNIHPQPKADFSFNKPSICVGDDITVTDLSDGKDGVINQWTWDMGDASIYNTNSVTHTYADTITYTVKLYTVNSIGCNSDTVSKLFTVYPYPHVNAGPDRFILEGGQITLESVTFANDAQYLWTPSLYLIDNKVARPKVNKPLTDMTYTLTVTARGGCSLSDNVFVKLLKFPVIPNTFTPNNDGINDTWRIDFLNTYPENRVQIFTRSGQLVFESRGYNTPWDGTIKGKPLPFDTYYYIIEPGNGRDPITGYVTIIK